MKKRIILVLTGSLALGHVFSQQATNELSGIINCSEFHSTKPLREIAPALNITGKNGEKIKKESSDRQHRSPFYQINNPQALPKGDDPARQKSHGTRQVQPPEAIWEGLATGTFPPDPTGAAGPDHYVQAVNSSYQVFTKTGGSVPGGGPFSLGSLLFNSNDGDPIVLYDKYADRWVITEFKFSGKKVLFAISQTADPTGAYYTYQFTSPQFPDYEKFSIWVDGYYMTSNQDNQKVFVFERDSMLAGVASSRAVYQSFNPANGSGFFCPLPADADGQLPPSGTPCPIVSYEDDGWGSGYVDRINLYDAAVTWGTTPSLTITLAAQLPTEPFDASYNQFWNDVAQPGTNQKLDGLGGVFTFRAQYRVWTGYNTLVLNKGVKVNTTSGQRSLRWYELRQDAVSGNWSIYQQSTFAPDDLNRWMGSMAMDDNGSIGMVYAVSGSTDVYPSIRYTGRLASDSLNMMTFEEEEAATGNSSQIGTNRYGDYFHTALDPLDGTLFWNTGEYIDNGDPATKIFSFRIPDPSAGLSSQQNALDFRVYHSLNQIHVEARNLPYDKELVTDLFDVGGRLITGTRITPVSGFATTSFPSTYLSKGTYLVRIGYSNTSFQRVAKVTVK